jgi:hypothetical protein
MRGGLWERCERVETDRKSSAGALHGESSPISEANKGRTYRMSKTVFRDKTRLVATLSCLLFLGITLKAEAQKTLVTFADINDPLTVIHIDAESHC